MDELIQNDSFTQEDLNQILFYTAAFGDAKTLTLLKEKGVDLEAEDDAGNTPLIISSNYGNFDTVKYLLDQGANIETHTIKGNYPLYVSVKNDHYDVAEYLVKKGANIKPFVDDYGTKDMFAKAAENGNVEMMKMLAANGFPFNNDEKALALNAAASSGKINVIQYLLEIGTDINSECSETTPLQVANNLDTIKFLVENGALVNRADGNSVRLFKEAEKESTDISGYLIQQGANVNSIIGGETPLIRAVNRGNFENVKLLIENGADPNFQTQYTSDNIKDTAIIDAASGGHNILQYLIEKGADVNYQNTDGQTALMAAASAMSRLENVKLLIANHADPTLKDNNGKTALDLASAKNNTDVADYLKNLKK